jgi:hypothetical protein
VFEAIILPRARWLLDRVSPAEAQRIEACITELEHNPFPAAERRTPLVTVGLPTRPDAYRCHDWAIAFSVADVFVVIEAIGPVWPPYRR